MSAYVRIAGWGKYLPARIMPNAELEGMVDTSDEWIRERTGIRQRHFVEPGTGELVGIAQQEPFVRQPAPKGERYSERVQRERESQVWERAVQAIGAPPQGVLWVHVGDRYSDIYTLFLRCREQQTHFVIRAAQDRCVDEQVEEVAPALKRRKRKALVVSLSAK